MIFLITYISMATLGEIANEVRRKLVKLEPSTLSKPIRQYNLSKWAEELYVIYPGYDIMRAVTDFYRHNQFLNITTQDLDKYISFTRFSTGMDKAYCDWCGICNGTMELFRDKLIEYFATRYNSNEFKTFYIPDYSKKLTGLNDLSGYAERIEEELLEFNAPEGAHSKIREFLTVVYGIEEIESRWCPFSYIAEITFDKPYYYYSPYNVDHLKLVQKILREQGKITCNNCIQILNDVEEIRTNEESIFEDYMVFLKKVVNGEQATIERSVKEKIIERFQVPTLVLTLMFLILIILIALSTYHQVIKKDPFYGVTT